MAMRNLTRFKIFGLSTTAVLLSGVVAHANVATSGNVAPADSPFTIDNEGINDEGNFVNVFLPVTDPEAWRFYETPANIYVGRTGNGTLVLNGESALRYHTVMIGGYIAPYPGYPTVPQSTNGAPINDPATRSLLTTEPITGRGIVRVEGFGTVLNNDPLLVPEIYLIAQGQDQVNTNKPTPDVTPRDLEEGHDMFVGFTGRGELNVNTGGSVEVQDSLFVGLGPRANGLVIVDGLGSSLLVNGVMSGLASVVSPDFGEFPSIIGGYGTGAMRVTNGAFADFRNGLGIGTWAATGINTDSPGAQDGGNRITDNAIQSGSIYVAGVGSRIEISGGEDGGLAIGEFIFNANAAFNYPTNYGRGSLTISQGGTVVVNADDQDNSDDVVIGHFGELSLPGGRLSVLDELTNDGLIKTSGLGEIAVGVQGTIHGAGRLDVGLFINRTEGEVRVGSGESLQVVSYGTNDPTTVDAIGRRMLNVGYIEVIGGELSFDRSDRIPTSGNRFENTVFESTGVNPGDPTTFTRGQILANGANLRFRSDLNNFADINFVGGNNVVDGEVFNQVVSGNVGVITVGGNGTSVAFNDTVNNAGVIDISPESSIVQFLSDLNNTGTIQLTLGGRQSGNGHIAVGEDLSLAGTLDVRIFDPGVTGTIPLQPQLGDAFELFSAAGELTGIFNTQILPPTPVGSDWFVDYNYLQDTVTLRLFDLTTVIGADFNGDGIVDATDLGIWQIFFGITSGASVLQGDADGDGDVDGDDLVVIVDQLGGPGMVPSVVAALPSSTPSSTAIPEPGTVGLAAIGLLALLVRRVGQTFSSDSIVG
jgi:hypothetical protein